MDYLKSIRKEEARRYKKNKEQLNSSDHFWKLSHHKIK